MSRSAKDAPRLFAPARMRSLMFVPGHRRRMVERALGLGEFGASELDVAILDLEDGVPPEEKPNARAIVEDVLERPSASGPARYVRINPVRSDLLEADLSAIFGPGLGGIVVPKVEEVDELAILQRALARGSGRAPVPIVASIESAKGLLSAAAIASASPRVIALLFGAEDYALDLGLPAEREGEAAELAYARASLVVAAVASARAALDGIWPHLDDTEGLRRDAVRGRWLGFVGKSCIHPAQIQTINEVFSPSAAEVVWAERVVATADEARGRGEGAVALEGKLIDPPIVERARRTLALRDALSAGPGRDAGPGTSSKQY